MSIIKEIRIKATARSVCTKIPLIGMLAFFATAKYTYASAFTFDIIGTLSYVQTLLMQVGPILSALLFTIPFCEKRISMLPTRTPFITD